MFESTFLPIEQHVSDPLCPLLCILNKINKYTHLCAKLLLLLNVDALSRLIE